MSSATAPATNYWQRRDFAYYLNPDVDWTRESVQSTWKSYGKHVSQFLSVDQPLTRAELIVLCKAYAVQQGDPNDEQLKPYHLDYALLELFEHSIVYVAAWWPITY